MIALTVYATPEKNVDLFADRKSRSAKGDKKMLNNYISPSVLAADFSALADEVARVEEGGANFLHLDVMDGMFVPNISFGAPVIASIRKHSSLIFDVHLMIKDPARYISDFIKAGADIITIHYESCDNPYEVIKMIKDADVKAVLAISPKTPWDVVIPVIDMLDMVLVMTVEPGFGGQKLILATLEKVYELRKYVRERGIELDIEVDGGIGVDNIGLVSSAGANVVVAGSAIFQSKKIAATIKAMKTNMKENPFKEYSN